MIHFFSFLDEIISLCDAYSLKNREFFFDRSPRVFEYILGIYRKGNTYNKMNEKQFKIVQLSLPNILYFFTKLHPLCSFYLKCSEGELHLPSSVCPRDFLGELEYWGLSALHLGLHFNLVKLQSNVMQNIFTIQRIQKYLFYFQLKIMDFLYFRAMLCLSGKGELKHLSSDHNSAVKRSL